MPLTELIRAHRRVLAAQRIQNRALQALVPGVGATYERLHKADALVAVATERYLQLVRQLASKDNAKILR